MIGFHITPRPRTPSYYGFLGGGGAGDGSGRTIPIGAIAHRDGIFGGAMVAYQELLPQSGGLPVVNFIMDTIAERRESSISQNNVYLFALGGGKIPGTGWSAGASVFSARLDGLEGVQRLYNANEIRHSQSSSSRNSIRWPSRSRIQRFFTRAGAMSFGR